MGGPWGPRATGAGTGQATVVATHGAEVSTFHGCLEINLSIFLSYFVSNKQEVLEINVSRILKGFTDLTLFNQSYFI